MVGSLCTLYTGMMIGESLGMDIPLMLQALLQLREMMNPEKS